MRLPARFLSLLRANVIIESCVIYLSVVSHARTSFKDTSCCNICCFADGLGTCELRHLRLIKGYCDVRASAPPSKTGPSQHTSPRDGALVAFRLDAKQIDRMRKVRVTLCNPLRESYLVDYAKSRQKAKFKAFRM